ncbi:hypothetical protein CVT26_005093 [Gymnopilus dilepis]|uniref:SMP-30/Gluconolactonase/LRE-like region domain-containing protein n=1 Tax=Gymnopilus dilepis TaxID=231916 RepID=A0A409Y061_9AGAR|nr:hypothetical protein CVT26_005093 [Gymnopilus dilepis]
MLQKVVLVILSTLVPWGSGSASADGDNLAGIPPGAVSVPPSSFAVLGQNATFRQNGLADQFNPTNTTPPFFQIFHPDFLTVLGPNPFIRNIAQNSTFASGFAFEAPIFVASTNELFFCSSVIPPESSMTHNNRISKIDMTIVEKALASKTANINVPFETLDLPVTVQITNGGTGPFKGSLLLTTRGRANLPSALVLVNPKSPNNNVTVLLDNFFGRQFNSMNDLKIHPSGKIFFTDDSLGFINGEKPPPLLPSQVYMFDPDTGLARVVADGVIEPNGIAFNPTGKIAYVGDSASLQNTTQPSTVYAFDVDPDTFLFSNRRVFAFIDTGAPDGIQVDTKGNLYVASGDGVQIFRQDGVLLGKVFIGNRVANMAFAGDGNLIVLDNTSIFLARIAAKTVDFIWPWLPVVRITRSAVQSVRHEMSSMRSRVNLPLHLTMLRSQLVLSTLIAIGSCATSPDASNVTAIPPGAVSIPPSSFAVLGQNATFRQNGFLQHFNPTNSTPPFFQIFHPDFLTVLGPNAFVRSIAQNSTFASGFAFEAPIFNPPTNEMFFASSVFPPESDFNHTNRISKISMTLVENALASKAATINVPFETLDLPVTVQITNGGTGPFKGSLLLATRGRGNLPSALVLVNPKAPNNATVLLDNFFARQFDSMNDLKIHPSGKIFFTDDKYASSFLGYLQMMNRKYSLGFTSDQKPPPLLPSQVYMFDPETSLVRMVADNFVTPNGIAFNPTGKIAYVGDSAGITNSTLPSTVYAFDVDPETFFFSNRRVFTYIDSGGPDGIQVDTKGNLYVASGDGVQIFRQDGVLLGKVFIGSDVANMAFAGDGNLIVLANTSVFLARIAAKSALVSI